MTDPTPVQDCGGWTAKRDDMAHRGGADQACGAKVRQYLAMAAACPDVPMVVGCSAHSAQQIYIADAALRCGRRALVFIPQRAAVTDATLWAQAHGAVVHFVRPGYPAVYRKRAKEAAAAAGGAVRWDPALAVRDTIAQASNVLAARPARVIVPTGSGLVAAGVLVAFAGTATQVVAVAVSDMARQSSILARAAALAAALAGDAKLPPLKLVRHPLPYERPVAAQLPDGTPLDPYYAAKALGYVELGDCLWVTGCRPLTAFPAGGLPQK